MVNRSAADIGRVYAALADATRRAILERLAREGATVTELAEPFDMSLPAISKHLRVLETAGLIRRRVDGRVHRLGLEPGPLMEAARWLEAHRSFWEPRLDSLVAYVEKKAKEEASWTHRKPRRKSRSASSERSQPRPTRSSAHGRKRKR